MAPDPPATSQRTKEKEPGKKLTFSPNRHGRLSLSSPVGCRSEDQKKIRTCAGGGLKTVALEPRIFSLSC